MLSLFAPLSVFINHSNFHFVQSPENGRILSAVDVMRDLVRRGVDQTEFLPR